MAVKIKYGNPARSSVQRASLAGSLLRGLLVLFLVCLIVGSVIFGYFYYHYQKIVDERLAAGPMFAPVTQIYAAAKEIRTGQHLTVTSIAQDLRRAGYNSNPQLGSFQLGEESITIKPGPESFHSTDGATIQSDGTVQSISAENGATLRAYELEPQLISSLSEDKNRTKRRLVTYQEIPSRMVEAVTAIEDRRFFEHSGINFARMGKCAFVDLVSHHMQCGGSTLTQQLARGFFLTPDKKITRKLREIMITFQLEARFNKRQIFELYANQINLGQRGSFAINGFGEAAQAFFGKDLRQLDTAECALLAGMIQSPSRLNPYRHPDRAMDRRNLVLEAMVETGTISPSEATRAKAEPLRLSPPNVDASEAPYFIDLVHEQLSQRVSEQELGHDTLRIYTSLDPELQIAASAAVEVGMRHVDELVRKQRRNKGDNIVYPQVSLVALNPHTGQILALVGGRNYGVSQLNHAISKRPTGSIFKPFVYATAYNTSLNGLSLGEGGVFTALTQLNDNPQDFGTGGQSYTPGNFQKGEYPGMVTAATAIEHSLNIATIALAHMVGYENVAALARNAGITAARATPSVAIGTYSATPIEMAGAYTVFANNGVRITPWMLASVRNANGDIVSDFAGEGRQVLDPRAAYLTQSLLEGVMARGTGSAVRRLGFNAPAAGKTGTSHDVWFAGYSSNLLCIVWVGNDDYTNLELEGAKAAAPIWAEFMNRAIKLPQYSDMKGFTAPAGVTTVRLDRTTNLLADASCPVNYNVAFLDGTAPQNTCSQMSESPQTLVEKLFGTGTKTATDETTTQQAEPSSADETADPTLPKKKNFLQKLFGGQKRPQPDAVPASPPSH